MLHILLALYLNSLISALILPQSLNLIQELGAYNQTASILPFTSGFGVCSSHITQQSTLPTFSDCEKVIARHLSSNPAQATFHSIGADDAFKLPVSREYGSCRIEVTVGRLGVMQDRASWMDIREAAMELNEVCRVDDVSGGKIQAGEQHRIWIKLSATK